MAKQLDAGQKKVKYSKPKSFSISRMFAPASNPDVIVTAPNTDVKLDGVNAQDFLNYISANTVPTETAETVNTVEEPAPAPQHHHYDPMPLKPINHRFYLNHHHHDIGAQADNEPATAVKAGFGTEFPANPSKGEMFLRVDYLPSKLYKWNEKKWIEVDKAMSDQMAYDEQYIKHLIDKLDSGEYDVDLLTPAEEIQIERYLNEHGNSQ